MKFDTLQKIFDFSVEFIKKQPKRCVTKDGYCTYKNQFGENCVVGAMIPDILHDKFDLDSAGSLNFEKTIANSDLIKALEESNINTSLNSINLMCDLQTIHDNTIREDFSEHRTAYEHEHLNDVANTYNLDTFVVETYYEE